AEEIPTIRLGESAASEETVGTETEAVPSESEEMSPVYQETDDYIIVTADMLNIRAEDRTDARIYIQLPRGEILHRTAYNEQWCEVEYDGGVAYVSVDMVEVTEAPVPETMAETAVTEETAEAAVAAEIEETEAVEEIPFNGHIVAIDAGCQAKANAEKEPIGPASQTKKAKMPEGAVGAATGVKEFELTLTVAKQLQDELKHRGYKVVMIRESHDVNLSQAERSKIANNSDAEIFIRLSANSMENSSIYGALAMCMTEQNPYNSELSSDSYRLSKQIINNICANTGTKNRGVQKVDNSSAINWCEIPVSVVEMGFLSNPDEDRWLQTEDYQKKIVDGISDAIDRYFAVGSEG
ncbi:MAG: N-acetylmuramoyl-L-alanine amidase, partial [Lachnospiraceae bacterium]|nr:N-acetylmuramoyl-L-alanine amidase [Lachnospiraceae bacterium]